MSPPLPLLDSASQYSLYESLSDGFLIISAEENYPITHVSAKFCQLTGYATEQLIGKGIQVLQPECTDSTSQQTLFHIIEAGGSYQGKQRICHHENGFFLSLVRILPVTAGGEGDSVHYACLISDVTDMIRDEARATHALCYTQDANLARLKALQEQMGFSYYQMNARGEIISFDDLSASFVDEIKADAVQNGWMDFIHPDERAHLIADFSSYIESNSLADFQGECRLLSGCDESWVRFVCMPLCDQQGAISGYSGVSWDVTALKRNEHEFRSSNHIDSLALTSSSVGYWQAALDGTIIGYDLSAAAMFGTDDLSLYKGVNWLAAVSPDDRGRVESNWQRYVAQGDPKTVFSQSYQVVTEASSPYVKVVCKGVHDNEDRLQYYSGVLIDVSAERKSELALMKLHERYERSQNAALIGSWEWDIETNAVWWSQQTYALFEMDPGEVSATFENYMNSLTAESQALVQQQVAEIMRDGKDYTHFIHLKNNPAKTLEGRGTLVKNQQGQPIKLCGTIQDVTEMYQKHEQVEIKQQELKEITHETERALRHIAQGHLSEPFSPKHKHHPILQACKYLRDTLLSFSSEVVRLATDVGTEGKLGGQANVTNAEGVWGELTESVNAMAQNLTSQVRDVAKVATAVAQGDLSQQVQVEAKGEINDLKVTVNNMITQLRQFSTEVTRIAREVGTEGKLGGQAVVDNAKGDWKELVENVNHMATNLTTQVRDIIYVTEAVACGDLSKEITVDVKGEVADFKHRVNAMVHQLRAFSGEVIRLATEVGSEGRLGGQANVINAEGVWGDLTKSVNAMAQNLTSQVRDVAKVATAVAQGDLTQHVQVEAKGEINDLKVTVNNMITQLRQFSTEVTRIAREVGTEGKLGGQAVVDNAKGDWKELVENVNHMATNLTTQVRDIIYVTEAVACGDLSKEITVDVKGEVADFKHRVNAMVHQLRAFSGEVIRLATEVGSEGRLGGQANVINAEGVWSELTESVNTMAQNLTTQVREINRYAESLADGVLDYTPNIESPGEIKRLVDSLALVQQHFSRALEAAEAISNGDFNREITPVSEYDILGKTLGRMTQSLKEKTEKLSENATLLNEFLHNSNDVFIRISTEFTFLYFSKAFYAIVDQLKAPLVGESLTKLSSDLTIEMLSAGCTSVAYSDDHDHDHDHDNGNRGRHSAKNTLRFRVANGNEIIVFDADYWCIRDIHGVITEYHLLARDITQQQVISSRNQLLYDMMKTTTPTIGIAEFYSKKLVWVNHYIDGADYPHIGQSFSNSHSPEQVQYFVDHIEQDLIQNLRWEGEWAILDSLGNEVPVHAQLMVHHDADNQPAFFSAVFFDLRERKQQDRDAAVRRQQMYRLMNAAVVSEAASSLAHQLNQPIASICSSLQLMKQQIAESDLTISDDMDDSINFMIDQSFSAGKLIHRVNSSIKRSDFESSWCLLESIIQESIDNVGSHRSEVEYDIRVSPALRHQPIFIDRILMSQALINILTNAQDELADANIEKGRIRIDAEHDGKQLLLLCSDNGRGVRSADDQSIFEPFYTTKDFGTGIGLPWVQSTLETMGGGIECIIPNERTLSGACFEIILPAAIQDNIAID